MKDLVPKGTGNSRFLRSSIPADITHQELVALLRAGTFPVDFAGLNADGVAVVGSAYNKANVLPDDVCNSLEIPTESEPKDAFARVSSALKPYKLLEKVKSSKTWVCPDGITMITALLVAGGGGGSGSNRSVSASGGGGGQGGACLLVRDIKVTPGQSYKITIGSGGAGGSAGSSGSKGGNTTAFGFTAKGGAPGTTDDGGSDNASGSFGGRGSNPGTYGGPQAPYLTADSLVSTKYQAERLYMDPLYGEWYGSGGGGANAPGGPNAGNGGDSDHTTGYAAVANFGGGGGGGYFVVTTNQSGGKGGSGAVLIYTRGD